MRGDVNLEECRQAEAVSAPKSGGQSGGCVDS